MSIVGNLKVNRDLLDYKFEGYKLSLDPIPVLKQPINPGVEHFKPCGEYSYLQLHMSSHFNHLFQDTWSLSCMYFITKKHTISWCSLMQDGRLSSIRTVWELPQDEQLPKSNAAISFPSADWAVVSNGCGSVYLLHTPSRAVGEPWTLCHSYNILECQSSCYLLDSVHLSLISRQQVDCLLAYFSAESASEDGSEERSPPFKCIIEWLTFSCGQNIETWNMKRIRRIVGSSPPLYVSLEKSSDAAYIASATDYKFMYDSEKPVTVKEKEIPRELLEQPPLYTYMQTPEDITVVFRLPEQASKSDIQVIFQPTRIEVLYRGDNVLSGELMHPIDCTCSTWVVCKQRLEIIVCKAEVGLMWTEFIKGNKQGAELMDPELVELIHSRLAHLTSETEVTPTSSMPFNLNQLEDCDSCTDVLTFIRADGNSHENTHKFHMGGHQWLFSCLSDSESSPLLCLRHDVDGLVWQPRYNPCEVEVNQFQLEHVATFCALGYVQASKQDKRFTSCAPDFSYAVISDCNRHVYIYCRPENLNSALHLRNRKTGESVSHVAKQYVMNLENCTHILGLRVTNECIFVLSSNMLYVIKMCSK